MTTHAPSHPDLGQHAWHEEGGFIHGHLNGFYYRMVCTPPEFEEIREQECTAQEKLPDDDDVWWAVEAQHYVDPWHSDFGEFESASPFEEDLDDEARRRILAYNMYLDPQTTTWYRLGKAYDVLMQIRRQEDRRKVLRQRSLDLGLDPKKEMKPAIRRLRAKALAFGLNPYPATWQDISSKNLELHKIILPDELTRRASKHLDDLPLNFEELLQTALVHYLDHLETSPKNGEKESPDGIDGNF